MGCSSCAGRYANSNLSVKSATVNVQSAYTPTDCNYTKAMLEKWKRLLECVLLNNKSGLINLTDQKVRSYLGYIQSALNYPDNYCFYKDVLQDFELNILPRIIVNVPNCNNY